LKRIAASVALVLVVALLGGAGASVFSDLAWRKRKQERELRDWTQNAGRYVDVGVELRVVVADEVGGAELLEGKPKLRVLRTHYAGGIIDTQRRPRRIVAASQQRTIWYCSEEQEAIILHPDADPLGILIYGSEGGGKTETLPMWHYFRWLENLGERREAGQLAPTNARLEVFLEAFRARFPASWYRYRSSKRLITLCDGTRIRCVSTHQQSRAQGSRVQGYGWSWAGADECQDYLERWEDIEARGRAAKAARYKQARTATAKDTSEWRSAKDKLLSSGDWSKRTLLGLASPFIPRVFWETKKRAMSPREYERRVLAMDVGVELAVYHGWDRKRNLVQLSPFAIDVTPAILADYQSYACPGARFSLLACHDPGNICNVTEVLRLVVIADIPTWVVCGEKKTEQTTAARHAAELVLYLQDAFGVERRIRDRRTGKIRPDPESSKVALFLDPHGKGETQTDYETVYGAFQAEGIDVFSPAPLTGRIKRRARVEMMNRLLCDATRTARLVVAADRDNQPAAPVLVDAIETLEKRPGDDDPEGFRRKDKRDKTHAPAAVGYGMWPFEQQALMETTIQRALAAARRVAA